MVRKSTLAISNESSNPMLFYRRSNSTINQPIEFQVLKKLGNAINSKLVDKLVVSLRKSLDIRETHQSERRPHLLPQLQHKRSQRKLKIVPSEHRISFTETTKQSIPQSQVDHSSKKIVIPAKKHQKMRYQIDTVPFPIFGRNDNSFHINKNGQWSSPLSNYVQIPKLSSSPFESPKSTKWKFNANCVEDYKQNYLPEIVQQSPLPPSPAPKKTQSVSSLTQLSAKENSLKLYLVLMPEKGEKHCRFLSKCVIIKSSDFGNCDELEFLHHCKQAFNSKKSLHYLYHQSGFLITSLDQITHEQVVFVKRHPLLELSDQMADKVILSLEKHRRGQNRLSQLDEDLYTIKIEPKDQRATKFEKIYTIQDEDEDEKQVPTQNIITNSGDLYLDFQSRKSLHFAPKLNQANVAGLNYQRKINSIVKTKRQLNEELEQSYLHYRKHRKSYTEVKLDQRELDEEVEAQKKFVTNVFGL